LGPSGVDIASQGEAVLETFSKDPANIIGLEAHLRSPLAAYRQPSLITPEHGLHVLEVMTLATNATDRTKNHS